MVYYDDNYIQQRGPFVNVVFHLSCIPNHTSPPRFIQVATCHLTSVLCMEREKERERERERERMLRATRLMKFNNGNRLAVFQYRTESAFFCVRRERAHKTTRNEPVLPSAKRLSKSDSFAAECSASFTRKGFHRRSLGRKTST